MGSQAPDLNSITKETIELAKQAMAAAGNGVEKGGITEATGLTGVDLEAPAKKTYPVLAPLGRRFARDVRNTGAKQVDWKDITGINTANIEPGVAEGLLNTEISYSEVDRYAKYKTLNMPSSLTDEAFWKAKGFEDAFALASLTALQALQIGEEQYILGGNTTVTGVAVSPGPVPTLDVTGGTGVTGTISVKVVPLTLMGYLQSTISNEIGTAIPVSSNKGLAGSGSTGAITNKRIVATWTAVPGAVAYGVFAGTAGSERLQDIVTVNAWSSIEGAALTVTGQLFSALTDADQSQNALAFDGIIYQAFKPGSGAYIRSLNNVALTADGAGGIKEFDTLLKALWDNRRVGPSLCLMNSQEAINVTAKIGGAAASALGIRINTVVGPEQKNLIGGIFISGYLNKFTSSLTPGNPDIIPFMIHPFMPPGMVIFITETLPYPKPEIGNVFQLKVLQPYTAEEFARTQRKRVVAVTTIEAFASYFSAGIGVIYNIKNG